MSSRGDTRESLREHNRMYHNGLDTARMWHGNCFTEGRTLYSGDSAMKTSLWSVGVLGLLVAGCGDSNGPLLPAPQNVGYQLEASGDPLQPAAVLLFWDPVNDPELDAYNVYSSPDGTTFDLRGTTTSITFHDEGVPDLVYFVRAVNRDGDEGTSSDEITIDERLRLETPANLVSTSLDGALHLAWDDNAFLNEPQGFRRYRVYSASYTLGDTDCGTDWALEGTTVSPEFLVGALTNGVSRCLAVASESIEGFESLWSNIRADTPRPDARNILVFRLGADVTASGFRFFEDLNANGLVDANELGRVVRGDAVGADFRVTQTGADLFLEPIRAGTSVALYSTSPVEDLTSIDLAPETGFSTAAIQASPGFGYVFQMDGGDGFARFGGLRVTHVGADYLIFDWSYQTDPGNPELEVRGGLPITDRPGIVIRGVR